MDQREKTDNQCFEMLRKIFSDRNELLFKIAPNGWINSEFIKIFHPTGEQQYYEHKQLSEQINRLKSNSGNLDIPDLNSFQQDSLENINVQEEFDYTLGLCVYDIFSNNHTVYDQDGIVFNLGSMRGSGLFMSNFFNLELDTLQKSYDYMDFYMGSIWVNKRADLSPFYEYIFSKLKLNYCDWQYEFPRLYTIAPQKIEENKGDHQTYHPNDAVLEQIAEEQKEKENDAFLEMLDKQFEDDFEDAKYKPLPPLVQAYKRIYGSLPEGHPQKRFE